MSYVKGWREGNFNRHALTFSTDFDHLLFCGGRYRNVPTCKTLVQSCCSSSLNRLFCGGLVAVAVVFA